VCHRADSTKPRVELDRESIGRNGFESTVRGTKPGTRRLFLTRHEKRKAVSVRNSTRAGSWSGAAREFSSNRNRAGAADAAPALGSLRETPVTWPADS
jgi:hypothetical protein